MNASTHWTARTWNIVSADEELKEDLLSRGIPAQFKLRENREKPRTFAIVPPDSGVLPPALENVELTLMGSIAPTLDGPLRAYSESELENYLAASDQLVSAVDGRDVLRLEGRKRGSRTVITVYQVPGAIATSGQCGDAFVVLCLRDPSTSADGTAIGWN